MKSLLQLDIIIPLIVAPYCISIGIAVLQRLKSVKEKKEGIVFFFLSISAAAWSIGPFINQYWRYYGWIIAVILANMALIYTLLITEFKLIKIFAPFSIISTSGITYLLLFHNIYHPSFPVKFAVFLFPFIISINYVYYYYYAKHKTKFHLSLGLIATFMILGGFYDTFKETLNWLLIPGATIGTFGFVIVTGYHILGRGYLQSQGWYDYAIQLEQKEKLLKEKFNLITNAHIDSVIVLSQTIEAKDPYTRGHCLRVRDFSKALGNELGFNKEKLFFLELGAILHDIGKIGVPGIILNKNGKLTDKEYNIIKKHPDIGANIIGNIEFFKPVLSMVRHHHEFINGKGYPQGLKNNKIPIEAKILAVGDVFDAITSDRPYRKAYSLEKALSIIKEASGTQLDPEIVKIFISKKIYKITHNITEKLAFDF